MKKTMWKRGLLAALLCALLCAPGARAEVCFSPEVRDNVTGEWLSVFSHGEEHGLTFDWRNGRYAVADASGEEVRWSAEAIEEDGFQADLLPRSLDEVRRMNRTMAYLSGDALSASHLTINLKRSELLPVYAAPSEEAWRGSNGRAAVSLAAPITVLSDFRSEGWWLIEYDTSGGERRIGYIREPEYGQYVAGAWWMIPMPLILLEDAPLTDDPHGGRREIARFTAGERVTALGYCDGLWAYVQTQIDGREARGFLPLRALVRPEEELLTDVMADLTGEWTFIGGGEMLGLAGVIFGSDGTLRPCTTDDGEDVFPAEHLIADGEKTPYAVYATPSGEYAYALEITYEDGWVMRYGLEWTDASEDPSGCDVIGVYAGEGGGGYRRLGEPEFEPQPEEIPDTGP